MSDPQSLLNVRERWLPEIQKHCPEAPFWLVATKIDLRDDAETNEKLATARMAIVDRAQGEAMAAELGATGYSEISSLRQENIDETLVATIRHVLSKNAGAAPRSRCSVM